MLRIDIKTIHNRRGVRVNPLGKNPNLSSLFLCLRALVTGVRFFTATAWYIAVLYQRDVLPHRSQPQALQDVLGGKRGKYRVLHPSLKDTAHRLRPLLWVHFEWHTLNRRYGLWIWSTVWPEVQYILKTMQVCKSISSKVNPKTNKKKKNVCVLAVCHKCRQKICCYVFDVISSIYTPEPVSRS